MSVGADTTTTARVGVCDVLRIKVADTGRSSSVCAAVEAFENIVFQSALLQLAVQWQNRFCSIRAAVHIPTGATGEIAKKEKEKEKEKDRENREYGAENARQLSHGAAMVAKCARAIPYVPPVVVVSINRLGHLRGIY